MLPGVSARPPTTIPPRCSAGSETSRSKLSKPRASARIWTRSTLNLSELKEVYLKKFILFHFKFGRHYVDKNTLVAKEEPVPKKKNLEISLKNVTYTYITTKT